MNVTEEVSFYVGIGGNYYAVSTRKEALIEVCQKIDKSVASIYWNTKYACYSIRVKSEKHKEKLRWVMQKGKQLVS